MRSENYLAEELNPYTYRFFSIGRRGRFKMVVTLTLIDREIYNLGFGVWNEELDTADDSIEIRNGDTDKILATVAQIALNFIAKNPAALIDATGSCAARTRKYQMGISKYLPCLRDHYTIQGLIKDKFGEVEPLDTYPVSHSSWQDFRPGVNYDAFLLSLKGLISLLISILIHYEHYTCKTRLQKKRIYFPRGDRQDTCFLREKSGESEGDAGKISYSLRYDQKVASVF